LSRTQTAAVVSDFKDAFVAEPEARWWWAALRDHVVGASVAYGPADAWTLLQDWLPATRLVVLLVTDEESVAGGAVRGRPGELAALVGECPYFEYVVTDDTASFGIFDTHDNVLIRVGAVPD
jgi:hypothetical protein